MAMEASGDVILVVEDDPDIASALCRGLGAQGYRAIHAADARTALAAIAEHMPAAAIVDVMIGDESGLDLTRGARAAGFDSPVLMLSALADVDDRMAGIEAGADEYVVKPFSFAELLARLQVQLRRLPPARLALRFDPEARTLTSGAATVALTDREFQLARLLAEAGGEPMPRHAIHDRLWGAEGGGSDNVVDVYIGYLRRKLATLPDPAPEIKTIRNKGFVLVTRTR